MSRLLRNQGGLLSISATVGRDRNGKRQRLRVLGQPRLTQDTPFRNSSSSVPHAARSFNEASVSGGGRGHPTFQRLSGTGRVNGSDGKRAWSGKAFLQGITRSSEWSLLGLFFLFFFKKPMKFYFLSHTCIGANDKIFDHCLFRSSAPTTPEKEARSASTLFFSLPLTQQQPWTHRSVASQSSPPICSPARKRCRRT